MAFEVKKMQMSPPWVTFYKELSALFERDEEIRVLFDQEDMEIRLYVDNQQKAEALAELLPDTKDFGTVTVKITVITSNKEGDRYSANVWQAAFADNPALERTVSAASPFGTWLYVVWSAQIVQFFNDNMADFRGNKTMLMEQAAKDVFPEQAGIFHCSDLAPSYGVDEFHSPLGEWP